jgi:transposase
MRGYSHLTAAERDRIADLKAEGQSVRAIAQALGRSPATISRELRRNALASGAYRPTIAEGSYLLRRQRPAVLERDPVLAGYVTDRLAEGWTPEQIAGRLRRSVERGLRYVSTETIPLKDSGPGSSGLVRNRPSSGVTCRAVGLNADSGVPATARIGSRTRSTYPSDRKAPTAAPSPAIGKPISSFASAPARFSSCTSGRPG